MRERLGMTVINNGRFEKRVSKRLSHHNKQQSLTGNQSNTTLPTTEEVVKSLEDSSKVNSDCREVPIPEDGAPTRAHLPPSKESAEPETRGKLYFGERIMAFQTYGNSVIHCSGETTFCGGTVSR